MLEFQSVEEMQRHYQAVRKRIEAGKPKFRPKPPVEAVEPPPLKPLPPVLQEALNVPPVAPEINPVAPWDANGNPIKEPRPKRADAFEDEPAPERPRITLKELTDLVCNHTGIDNLMIWSPRRTKDLVKSRFLIWALAREFCHQHSLPTIGRYSGRDHTTILHGSREGKRHTAYPELARLVRGILDQRVKEPKS